MMDELRQLRDRVRVLEDRVMQLEDALGLSSNMVDRAATRFGLSPVLAQMFAMMMAREIVSREQFDIAIPSEGLQGQVRELPKVFDVHIFRMRKRLVPFSIPIHTRRGFGNYMTRETKVRALELMSAA